MAFENPMIRQAPTVHRAVGVREVMSPAQLGAYTRKELDCWGKVIKSSKITAE